MKNDTIVSSMSKRLIVKDRLLKCAGYALYRIGGPIVHCILFISFTSCQSKEETDRQKYISEGISLYKNNCANCHQVNGAGLAGLYPPLAGSDYLKKNKNAVICSIKYGQQGTIVVNGKRYNRIMPAQLGLSTLEVAEITTYIYHKWGGDEKGMITAKEVQPILDGCVQK